MKKFILPIIISIFLLFSPSHSLAQSSTDCWPTHMIRQYASCSPPHSKCLKECSRLDTTPQRKVCFDECGRVNKICTDKAVADYRTCVNATRKGSDAQVVKQLQPSVEPTSQPESSPKAPHVSSKDDKTGLKDDDWITVLPSVDDVILVTFTDSDIKRDQQPISPRISQDFEDNLFSTDSWQKLQTEKIFKVTEPTIFNSGDKEFLFELRPGKSSESALIHLEKGSNLLYLEDGEIEVIKKDPGFQDGGYDGIKTPNGTIISVQTHYAVTFDKKTNETTVAIYEGQVEVKTNDAKKTMVIPNGDKPSAIVISQKLSPVKIGTIGVVLTIVIGGVFLFLKRKISPRGFGKNKK